MPLTEMGLTQHQLEAISAEGDVLLLAGAGAGKTQTLVKRCVERLLRVDGPTSLDRILMVTFTEAAASEMRHRIRMELQRRLDEQPGSAHLTEQIALLDSATIGTLHSFCLRLIRDHFNVLDLDPQLQVLDETQAHVLATETLEDLLRRRYLGSGEDDLATQEFILTYGQGWDDGIRQLIRHVHDYSRTLPNPETWLDAQQRHFEQAQPDQWLDWLLTAVNGLRDDWLADLQSSSLPNLNQLATQFTRFPERPTRADAAGLLEAVRSADLDWGRRKTKERPAFKRLFTSAKFLADLASARETSDPLIEDWSWLCPQMLTLIRLVREYGIAFANAKRQNAALDFHDLEQFALRLLWNASTNSPSGIAQQWRERLESVFVDEYQDINAAQDRIISALGREGARANRFLVGDVKQCIYRFRLANPRIFQRYAEDWKRASDTTPRSVIPLADNFRSREAILEFVNIIFAALMRRELDGVSYDAEARLRFGQSPAREALGLPKSPAPAAELLLQITRREVSPDDNDTDEEANLSELEREARQLGLRLRQLREDCFSIWDREHNHFRPVEWSDMVVLLRAPSGRANIFAQEFARLGVPSSVAGGEFYAETEISDLLSLLTLLDNPLQDVPAIAVVRSPFVGLTLDELALVRLALPHGRFWAALQRFHEQQREASTTQAKVSAFLASFGRWRKLARQAPLSRCLETILDDTHFEDWLLSQPRGEARRLNVHRLISLTRRFDSFQRLGLHRFQQFVAAQREAEASPEPAVPDIRDCVRLMSIHQSKGLEFPIVAVAALGTRFNLSSRECGVMLDERFGLCAKIRPPGRDAQYPSLPYQLARQRHHRESLGEELRLIYVAMTRACDRLILSGSATGQTVNKWSKVVDIGVLPLRELLAASHVLGWLGPLVARLTGKGTWLDQPAGSGQWLAWRITSEDPVSGPGTEAGCSTVEHASPGPASEPTSSREADTPAAAVETLRERLVWRYAHEVATHEPAKGSVSALRHRMNETDEETRSFLSSRIRRHQPTRKDGVLSAAEIGVAHHRFLEHLSWNRAATLDGLRAEARRLSSDEILRPEEVAALDLPAVAAFFQSDLGHRLRGHAGSVKRELEFTARFTVAELVEIGLSARLPSENEQVVIQGVADLVAVLPDALWLVDFKTERIEPGEVAARLREHEKQMGVYARALERIFNRPVKECSIYFIALRRFEQILVR